MTGIVSAPEVHLSCSIASFIVPYPSEINILPIMTQSIDIRHRLGLLGKCGIGERCRVGRLTLGLAGSGLCHFAGGVNRLSHGMGGIVLADNYRSYGTVILRPAVDRCTPPMTGSIDEHSLGLSCKCFVLERCSVRSLTICLTGCSGCNTVTRAHRLGFHMSSIMLADAACLHLAVVSRPSVGRSIPVVAQRIDIRHSLGLRLKGIVGEGRRIGRLAL